MKKALVILLTLAVAGGLFAQTLTWSASMEGGFGMLNRGDADDMVFGAVSPQNWVNGSRLQLQVDGTNADGNMGFRARLRTNAAGIDPNTFWHHAWGWVSLFDGLVEVRGGRLQDTVLAMQDPVFGAMLLNHQGAVAYIRPTDTVTLGFGGGARHGLGDNVTWDTDTSSPLGFIGPGPSGGLDVWAALGFRVPGAAEIRAQLITNHHVTHALVGLQLTAIDNIPIDVFVRAHTLNEFADEGQLIVHGFVGLNVVQDLNITLGATFGMNQVDNTDPFMAFGGWLEFLGLGNVVPRLDAWFVSGGDYGFTYGFAPTGAIIDPPRMTWNSDQSYLNFRPALRFRATPASWWEVGALVNVELGDVGAAGGTSDDTLTWGLFTAVRIVF